MNARNRAGHEGGHRPRRRHRHTKKPEVSLRDPVLKPVPAGTTIVRLTDGAAAYLGPLRTALGARYRVTLEPLDAPDIAIISGSDPDLDTELARYRTSSRVLVIGTPSCRQGEIARILDAGADRYLDCLQPEAIAAHVRALMR